MKTTMSFQREIESNGKNKGPKFEETVGNHPEIPNVRGTKIRENTCQRKTIMHTRQYYVVR